MKKIIRSKGFDAVISTILKIVSTADFINDISVVRKSLGIDIDGFILKRGEKLENYIESISVKKWIENSISEEYDPEILVMLETEVKKTLKKYELYDYRIIDLVTPFFLIKNINPKEFKKVASNANFLSVNLCELDMKVNLIERYRKLEQLQRREVAGTYDTNGLADLLQSKTNQFPIVIGISAYASISDIVDYIHKNSKGIKKIQDECTKGTVTKGRKRTTYSKYNFIWENRTLNRTILAEMVNKKFGGKTDAIYIRNIISKEKKRRG